MPPPTITMSFSSAVAGVEALAGDDALVEAHLQHIEPRRGTELRRALRISSRVAAIACRTSSPGPQSREFAFLRNGSEKTTGSALRILNYSSNQ